MHFAVNGEGQQCLWLLPALKANARISFYSNIENLEPDKWKGARKEQKFNPELIELGLL